MNSVNLGQCGNFTAAAFSDGTIGIEEDFGEGMTIPVTNLLFFIQEYQKHYPIIAQIEPGSWKGMKGTS